MKLVNFSQGTATPDVKINPDHVTHITRSDYSYSSDKPTSITTVYLSSGQTIAVAEDFDEVSNKLT
jgi:hypothetical protein